MRVIEGISYGQGGELDLYLPDGECFDVFVFFHGGGIEKGSRAEATRFASDLADQGVCVVSADYRMYPDAKYPDFIEDAAEAVAYVREHIEEYGRCRRLIVGGSSAGAYLSMMLCFDGRYLGAHGIDPIEIDGWVHGAGQPTAHFRVLKEHGEDPKRLIVDERAPLYFVGRVERYSPILFLVSDHDMQNRYEQTVLTLSTLKHFGHEGERVQCRVMEGKHCAFFKEYEKNGINRFARIFLEWLPTVEERKA